MEKCVGDVFVITKNYFNMSFAILLFFVNILYLSINFLIETALSSAQ